MADAVERRKFPDATRDRIIRLTRFAAADRRNHEVLRRVLGGDELEDLGAVTGPFQELRAQRVGDELRLPFLENAVAQTIATAILRAAPAC